VKLEIWRFHYPSNKLIISISLYNYNKKTVKFCIEPYEKSSNK